MRTATRNAGHSAIRTRHTYSSPKGQAGLLPFQPRPQLPSLIMKEAKRLHGLGIAITDIHRLLSDPKCYVKVPGFHNADFNYYDFWDLLGYNRRKIEKATA